MGVLQMQLATSARDVDTMISKENRFERSDGVFHPSSRDKNAWYVYNISKGDQVKMMKVQPGEANNVIHSNAKEFDTLMVWFNQTHKISITGMTAMVRLKVS